MPHDPILRGSANRGGIIPLGDYRVGVTLVNVVVFSRLAALVVALGGWAVPARPILVPVVIALSTVPPVSPVPIAVHLFAAFTL